MKKKDPKSPNHRGFLVLKSKRAKIPHLGTFNASRAGPKYPLKLFQIIYRYTTDWGNLCTTSEKTHPPPFYFLSQFKSKLQCGWHQWQKWNNCQRQALLETFIFWGIWSPCWTHCKDTIPKIRKKYSQKRNCATTFPVPTFMFLWAIYIFAQSVCLFCCRQIGGLIVGI